jgi:glyoxylase-like metal-dependent hydrolase (beta-lactamase superfamily II)
MSVKVKAFFDEPTWTLTYVAYDGETGDAVLIDPVLDFDPLAWSTTEDQMNKVKEWIHAEKLNLKAVIDTHAHADHISGIQVAKRMFDVPMGIGKSITAVQETFKDVYNFKDNFKTDGSQFDFLVDDNEEMTFGSLKMKGLHTPGHTPACMSYQFDDAIFTGDLLFMPDMGTGRCDFPKGSAEDMYNSITQKIYSLPNETRLFVGHDYMPGGRDLAWESTVGAQKEMNVRLKGNTSEADFIQFRAERDRQLNPPKLIFQSIQVNVNGGELPEPEDNGRRYLKIPLNLFS